MMVAMSRAQQRRDPGVCRILLQALLMQVCCLSCANGQSVQEVYRLSPGKFATHVEYHAVNLDPGGEVELANLVGPGLVTYFYITDNSGSPAVATTGESGAYYPGLTLKIYWDDAKAPSVWVPLWDFFGAMDRTPIEYQSALLQLNHRCFMSHLPMPFSRRARFVLANDGAVRYSRSMAYGIDYEKNAAYAMERSRFHATWKRSNPTQDGLHTILDVQGSGHYLGNFLQVFTRYAGWWGEGDTIFDVDGEAMTHTPGTEDEYGACWGFEHTFSYLYAGYIQNEAGKNRMYRWYVTNPVRFQKSLKVVIQNQRNEARQQVPSKDDYTSVAYWYQDGAHPAPALQAFGERTAATQAVSYTK
jgi:hypothetical protein